MEKFHNINEMMQTVSEAFPDRPAIIYSNHNDKICMTYRELCHQMADRAQSCRQEDWHCAGISGQSTPDWIVTALAAAMAGKRVVLMDPALSCEHAEQVLRDTGVDYFYCDDPDKKKAMQPVITQNFQAQGNAGEIEDGGDFLFYTSGTTASGKAVVLSQEALCSSAWNGQQMLPCSEEDVILSMLPLFHVFGFVCSMLWGFSQGAAVALGRGLRHMHEDPAFFEPTILPVVPSQLKYLLSRGLADPRLRVILAGAGPADEETLAAAAARGVSVRFGYGLTETASGVAMSLEGEDPQAMAPCPDTTFRVADDGELFVRTSCMMKGYYHRPEETADVLQDGELATGDLVRADEEGRLHIVGRKKDILVLPNGTKIFCAEVERRLGELLQTQVALTLHGNRVALVVLAVPSLAGGIHEKVAEFNKTLPRGQQILEVIVRDEPFPRTSTGKIKRYLL